MNALQVKATTRSLNSAAGLIVNPHSCDLLLEGITKESAVLIEMPGEIRRGLWISVSSVQCLSRQPPKVCSFCFGVAGSHASERFALRSTSVSLNELVISHISHARIIGLPCS